ncbi:MAG: hypothetical protein V3R99_05425 [Thermoguttaceae bacterium]
MTDTELLANLQRTLVDRGAAIVAVADLQSLPADVRAGLPRAVCIGVALDPSIVAGIVDGPTLAYADEYQRVNELLNRLAAACAEFLRERDFRTGGGRATAGALDEKTLATALPHKTVATLAGVGWIGKCALLIHETYGSAVRYNSVLTDAPLPVNVPIEDSRCGECSTCVERCPVDAPSGRPWEPTFERSDFFDAFACCEGARAQCRKIGIDHTICGICIVACPYTQRYLARE